MDTSAFEYEKNAFSEKSGPTGEKYLIFIHSEKLSFLIYGIEFSFESHLLQRLNDFFLIQDRSNDHCG